MSLKKRSELEFSPNSPGKFSTFPNYTVLQWQCSTVLLCMARLFTDELQFSTTTEYHHDAILTVSRFHRSALPETRPEARYARAHKQPLMILPIPDNPPNCAPGSVLQASWKRRLSTAKKRAQTRIMGRLKGISEATNMLA